jgi:hypothetical protein
VDNLNVHSATDVLLFALAHPRWEFVFQPKYAAYLNLIEPWWKILRSLALNGRRFETWPEIEEAVRRATAYWNEMAVGNRVTPVPPHRTGRAAFPHPAPTSDNDGKALQLSVCAPASVTRFPGSVSGACVAGSRSPRPPPFAPSPPLPVARFCSATSPLL